MRTFCYIYVVCNRAFGVSHEIDYDANIVGGRLHRLVIYFIKRIRLFAWVELTV